MSLKRVAIAAGVLLLLGFLAGAYQLVSSYFEGRGRLEELGRQRDELVETARTLNARVDSSRAVGDTIGRGAAAVNAADLASFTQLERDAAPIREIIVERADPDALRLDSLRLAQIGALQRVVARDSITIRTLTAQLFDERRLSDDALANRDVQIANLTLQVETATSMLPGGFFAELLDDWRALAVGGALGAAACYAWCPRGDDAPAQYSIQLGRFAVPF